MKNKIILAVTMASFITFTASSAEPAAQNIEGKGEQASITFTNASGKEFTLVQLAQDLKELRAAVDRLSPALAAFNHTYSGTTTNKSQSVPGAISELFNALGDEPAEGESGGQRTNVVSVLQDILAAQSGSASGTDARTLNLLVNLERSLRPVNNTLDRLRVTADAKTDDQPDDILTPTGRSSGRATPPVDQDEETR